MEETSNIDSPTGEADAPAERPAEPVMPSILPAGNAAERACSVSLDDFEGPLDLLLHLVRRHELDILNIPIAFVCEKYLEYLAVMEAMELEVAGDYLVMAATLAFLKSRELLPVEATDDEDEQGSELEDGPDPREQLIAQLLEYQKYRAAAAELDELPLQGRDVFSRGGALELPPVDPGLAPITLFRLAEAYNRVLERARVHKSHEVVMEAVSVNTRMGQLTLMLIDRDKFDFESLFLARSWHNEGELRSMLVVTFMSVLELVRLGIVHVHQNFDSDAILLERAATPKAAKDALATYDETLISEEMVRAVESRSAQPTEPGPAADQNPQNPEPNNAAGSADQAAPSSQASSDRSQAAPSSQASSDRSQDASRDGAEAQDPIVNTEVPVTRSEVLATEMDAPEEETPVTDAEASVIDGEVPVTETEASVIEEEAIAQAEAPVIEAEATAQAEAPVIGTEAVAQVEAPVIVTDAPVAQGEDPVAATPPAAAAARDEQQLGADRDIADTDPEASDAAPTALLEGMRSAADQSVSAFDLRSGASEAEPVPLPDQQETIPSAPMRAVDPAEPPPPERGGAAEPTSAEPPSERGLAEVPAEADTREDQAPRDEPSDPETHA